ncbi:hypothetical protein EC912_101797 [Luteibacter rhizovicinus]|uniref:Uncharacterized protein n=1 Tax=Luteibacter rhizovicinus TaxID=242606 RepID=A0A4R3YYP5_9GAMM|nr:hypothetical protein [Luteibacter rhizovicinus]TCV97780.1 hypothetical protein EC912_101797 [Luteibacter rhizovicinus]
MQKPSLKLLTAFGLCIVTSLGNTAFAAPCAPADTKMVGHYYLEGVMEVGSELLLRPDGNFEYALSAGAMDLAAHGCWSRTGERVTLISAKQGGPIDIHPVTTMSNDGTGSPESMIPVPLVDDFSGPSPHDSVTVAVGRIKGTEIHLDFVDGSSVSKVVESGDQVVFTHAKSSAIKRVGIKLSFKGEALRWFDNNEPSRRLFLFSVDTSSLTPQAFPRLELKTSGADRLVIASEEMGQGGTYVRH